LTATGPGSTPSPEEIWYDVGGGGGGGGVVDGGVVCGVGVVGGVDCTKA
jgi:hypothetical protein